MKNKSAYCPPGMEDDEMNETDDAATEENEGEVQNTVKPKKKKKRKGMAPLNGSGKGAPEKTMSRLDFYTKAKGLKLG